MTEQPKSKLMARLREQRARLGLVRVEVWVPRDAVSKVRAYVARLVRRTDGSRGSRDE